uniref:GTD-binding domain-containing protein n=1 Tax=Davidia involucrata TaxID=16924 RepID=A0A5B6ZV97_DAVIN
MAANKFATMLHRNTNKITLILIYAVLEWILIILLLLNSLFSYLIIKFADYFGLKTPCLWCSRVDHIFEPEKRKNSPIDLLCEVHATEISKLGFCSNHRKLAESQDMCEDCSSSRPDFHGLSKNFDFFPWVKQIGMIQNEDEKVVENGDVGLKCSCCGVSLVSKIYSPCIVIKPSWGVLDYTQKGNLIDEAGDYDNSDRSRSDCMVDRCEDEHGIENKGENQMLFEVDEGFWVRREEAEEGFSVSVSNSELKDFEGHEDDKVDVILEPENSNMIMEDPSSENTRVVENIPQHLEFFVGHDGCQLIPVELIDTTTEENQGSCRIKEEDHENCDNHEANLGPELQVEALFELVVEREAELSSPHEDKEEHKFAVLESMEIEENENSLIFHAMECDLVREVYEQVAINQSTHIPSEDVDDDANGSPVSEEVNQMQIKETESEVSIGTEIPDLDTKDEIQTQEIPNSYQCIHEDPSTSSANLRADDDHGCKQTEEETIECKTILVEMSEQAINSHLSLSSEINEIEEDRVPDTPTSIDSFHHLHRKLLLLERREDTEESLDGSVTSEFEGGDGIMTIEGLKSVLRAERKALRALYTELEEERSASAVAANQTMAMINRLQEERASMQMEALHYQRMMEEQSEYDQETLQLLNELMVKREKEKQELEKELEVYRKKVLDYEAREKMRMLRKIKDGSARSGTSSASCSNAEDSDGLSIDLNQEGKEEDGFYSHEESHNHNTPVDAVLNLEESLAIFEEERLSILDELKVLEEKLFTLSDEEEHLYEENGKHLDENSDFHGEVNGFSKEMNGKHHHQEKRVMGSKAKRLLPLFDAISAENENGVLNGHENGLDSDVSQNSAVSKIELENKKIATEEEVDHLYERLEALEADREFLKHCISSIKKGDKGMDLLQEILQHLRDLRSVELRVRNLGDGALV